MKKKRPILGGIAALALAAIAAGCSSLDTWQRERIFSPAAHAGSWYRDPRSGTEEFDIALDNGDRVHAWYWQHGDAAAPTVLYLHGSRWNLNGSAFRIEQWADMGFSVLAIDYRGFGRSTPRLPSEETSYEDAAAALRELARRQPDPTRRFVYGHSLGGAIAIELAATNDDASTPFAGLVVESSFTSIADMIRTMRWGWVPGLPVLLTQNFDSRSKLAKVDEPVLFIHGGNDRYIPPAMSEQLLAAATSAPPGLARLVVIEGASHSNAGRVGGREYGNAVAQFVRDAAASRAAHARAAQPGI